MGLMLVSSRFKALFPIFLSCCTIILGKKYRNTYTLGLFRAFEPLLCVENPCLLSSIKTALKYFK